MARADDSPLARRLLQSSKREVAEAHRALDLAEDRFDQNFSQRINDATATRSYLLVHLAVHKKLLPQGLDEESPDLALADANVGVDAAARAVCDVGVGQVAPSVREVVASVA